MIVRFVGALGLIAVLVMSSYAALTEPPSPTFPPPALEEAPKLPRPLKLTPEQEAALVEVRRILKEAWDVANSIVPPTRLPGTTAPEASKTDLERYKERLLRDIEEARFRAGDVSTASSTRKNWDLALAQLRYGHLQDAVRTVMKSRLYNTPEMLVVMKMLADYGDLEGAKEVAQAQVTKESIDPKRRQLQAELLAYLARRQAQVGQIAARETLRQAVEAMKANHKYPAFQYVGWTAIGCSQSAMGDQPSSAESFRNALQAALVFRPRNHEAQRVHVLRLIGRAAREAGHNSISDRIFQEAIQAASHLPDSRVRTYATGMVAETQIRSNDRAGGMQTFQAALKFAEGLPSGRERITAITQIVERQLSAGEREAATETIRRMRHHAEVITDPKERTTNLETVAWWEAKLITPQLALERAYALEGDDERQAVALASAAYWLIHSREPVLSSDVFQRMSHITSALLAKPLPNDQRKADVYLSNLARVQAVVTGALAALQTAGNIREANHKKNTYIGILSLLIKKKDISGAKTVAGALKEEWLPWDGTGKAMHDLAKIGVEAGDLHGAMTWAEGQNNLYVRAEALLGVALGDMEQQGIEDLRRGFPAIEAVGTGSSDTLTVGCTAL